MPILRFLDKAVEAAGVIAFVASSLLILVNVVNRYFVLGFLRWLSIQLESLGPVYRACRELFGSWSVMADEVPGYLLVWIAFLGAYLALRREGHIAFTMLVEALPRLSQRLLASFNTVLLLGFLIVLLVQSIRMILVSGATEIETAEIAQGWFMAIIPLSAGLFILALVVGLMGRFRRSDSR